MAWKDFVECSSKKSVYHCHAPRETMYTFHWHERVYCKDMMEIPSHVSLSSIIRYRKQYFRQNKGRQEKFWRVARQWKKKQNKHLYRWTVMQQAMSCEKADSTALTATMISERESFETFRASPVAWQGTAQTVERDVFQRQQDYEKLLRTSWPTSD